MESLLSIVNIDRMGIADTMLFVLLALADAALMIHLHRRRARRNQAERMMRSLQAAVQRANRTQVVPVGNHGGLVLQQAS